MLKLKYNPEPLKLPGLIVNSHFPTVVLHSRLSLFAWLQRRAATLFRPRRRAAVVAARFQRVERPPSWGVLI